MVVSNLTWMIIFNFFYVATLSYIYFSKVRIKNGENKIYKYILVTNLIGLILQFLCDFVSFKSDVIPFIITDVILRLYLVNFIVFVSLLIFYVIEVSFKHKKTANIVTLCVVLLITLFEFILPYKLHADVANKIYYTYGPAVQLVFFMSGILSMVIFAILIVKRKNVRIKKVVPIYSYLILGLGVMIIQMLHPELVITTAMESLICCMMYFTIENPDIQMIEQLNEAKSQAEKANHAKTDFLSNMSHEIRTPLNAIVGFSQALSEEDIPASAKEEVKDIISASESLLDIVNGILDISKIEANKLEIIDKEYSFKKIFDELVALTKARMGDKPLDFRYHYDESIPEVLYGDNVRVKQIILNLLTNSVKYTRQGFVDFKINSIIKDDVCRLIVSVEDSGIGIKKENIEKLFTKFERFDEKNTTIEGTGLGLAITKRLINLMNGKIVVQSVYGKGSRFTVAIDQKIVVNKTLEDIGAKAVEEFVNLDLTGKKILVVDDNKLNLKVATRLLVNYKSEIITIDSGFECVDRINNGEKFDLILMDDMMPKMSGVETLHKLKENPDYNIPTIALTANAIEGMKDKYLSEGFDDYLSKPIDKLELNKVINRFFGKN